jgi:myo-inositol-1(or 4)-monophosphatase
MPTWTTLIGLYRDGKPYLGLMHQPFVAETFYGSAEASFVRNRLGTTRLRVAPPKPLAQARAGTTTLGRFSNEAGFIALRKNLQLMRHDGDAYFFALMAAGQLDIALDGGIQIYDIAALIPIIEGAGGVAGSWDGGDYTRGGNVLTASCQSLFDEAKALLNSGA